MADKELELIIAGESEKPALKRFEEALGTEDALSQPIHHSLPRLMKPDGEIVEMPLSVFHVLQEVVHYMMQGQAFSVIPANQMLSTQQAADILNVSRPFLVKLLEAGELPFVKVGTHRRVQYDDLLQYKRRMRRERRKVLADLANISQEAEEY